jgi:hypothetical protein
MGIRQEVVVKRLEEGEGRRGKEDGRDPLLVNWQTGKPTYR